ncbi:hypothetical protein P5F61_08135 [Clostridium perfringens]|nr:hypothetical protein [Clostridium perfringens]HAT4257870.1 hypothetical protein [Clostridium perfringens]
MKKYLIEYKYDEKFHAGSKARDDVKNIVEKNKFNTVYLEMPKNKLLKLIHVLKLNNILKDIENESIVLIQWPLCGNKFIKPILRALKNKKCKLICLIHDITSLRSDYSIANEINILNKFDYIISHNNIMSKWLKNNGINSELIELNVFDYLCNIKKEIKEFEGNENVVFAGNLSEKKSGFIYKLSELNICFNLYGVNYIENQSNNLIYFGKFNPNELPNKLQGKYGLIWDGEYIDNCGGIYGEYLKINNPHKLSLYIASGLPIICWENCAISNFVKTHQIGFTIKSLKDLDNKIKVNEKNYNEMKKNIINLKKDVSSGKYLSRAIENILSRL